MLLMLQLCCVIKYHSVWHVDAVHPQKAESTSHILEYILIFTGGKLAWPISAEVKEVD